MITKYIQYKENVEGLVDAKKVKDILTKNGWIEGVDWFKEGKDFWGNGRPDAYGFYDSSIKSKLLSSGNYGGDLDVFLKSIGLVPINIWVGSAVHGWTHRLVRINTLTEKYDEDFPGLNIVSRDHKFIEVSFDDTYMTNKIVQLRNLVKGNMVEFTCYNCMTTHKLKIVNAEMADDSLMLISDESVNGRMKQHMVDMNKPFIVDVRTKTFLTSTSRDNVNYLL
jgi:hypothetical protein